MCSSTRTEGNGVGKYVFKMITCATLDYQTLHILIHIFLLSYPILLYFILVAQNLAEKETDLSAGGTHIGVVCESHFQKSKNPLSPLERDVLLEILDLK